jgi:predicted ATPase
MNMLQRMSLAGFKSIREMRELEFRPLNVLIGANGAGKSNLISFFKLLNFTMTNALKTYVAKAGYANSLLHFGSQHTKQIAASLGFRMDGGTNTYEVKLSHAAEDSLIFTEEAVSWQRDGYARPDRTVLGFGVEKTLLNDSARREDPKVRVVRALLSAARVYQFHDTSATSPLRSKCAIDENRYLMDQGGNLPAVLFYLKLRHPDTYGLIEDIIRQVAPFFDGFVLEPDKLNPRFIAVRWRERGTPHELEVHQLSDGSLRFMALATLLNLPEGDMPGIVIIDEPELGLHPAAIQVLVGLLQAASTRAQVIVSTQSVTLINQMDAADVIVVEREGGQSVFHRPDATGLEDWLSDYALGELWEKNVIGGRP